MKRIRCGLSILAFCALMPAAANAASDEERATAAAKCLGKSADTASALGGSFIPQNAGTMNLPGVSAVSVSSAGKCGAVQKIAEQTPLQVIGIGMILSGPAIIEVKLSDGTRVFVIR